MSLPAKQVNIARGFVSDPIAEEWRGRVIIHHGCGDDRDGYEVRQRRAFQKRKQARLPSSSCRTEEQRLARCRHRERCA